MAAPPEQPVPEQQVPEQQVPEQPVPEQPVPERPGAGRPVHEQRAGARRQPPVADWQAGQNSRDADAGH